MDSVPPSTRKGMAVLGQGVSDEISELEGKVKLLERNAEELREENECLKLDLGARPSISEYRQLRRQLNELKQKKKSTSQKVAI